MKTRDDSTIVPTFGSWEIESIDLIGIIASFLHCRDAIKLAHVNKSFYAIFLIPIIRNSFVTINTDKIANIKNSNVYNIFNTTNLHIGGIRKLREPIFLYIERLFINSPNVGSWANLRYISFGRSFNHRLDALPPAIEEIAFHPKSIFNQKVNNLRCTKLRRIYFGKFFNQRIEFLPQSIELIHFDESSRFDQVIRRVPAQLQEIYFGQWFKHDIDALSVAPKLRRIQFATRSQFQHAIVQMRGLTTLVLGMYYMQELDLRDSNIHTLRFHKLSRYNAPIQLPTTIRHLYLGESFNYELDIQDLSNLETIRFYDKSRFNHPIYLPASCHTVTFGRHYTKTITGGESLVRIKFAKNSKFTDMGYLDNLVTKNNTEVQHPAFLHYTIELVTNHIHAPIVLHDIIKNQTTTPIIAMRASTYDSALNTVVD